MNDIYRLGHANGTKRTYKHGLIAYNNFLRKMHFSTEKPIISLKILTLFISYLVSDLQLAYKTITVYVNAVRNWAIDSNLRDPLDRSDYKMRKYKRFMAGVQRYTKHRKRRRLAFKKREIKMVLNAVPLSGLPFEDRLSLKAAILVAFYGLLRVSEYTYTADNHESCLRRKDVKFLRNANAELTRVKLRIRRTKTSQFETDTYVDIFPNASKFCPVSCLWE